MTRRIRADYAADVGQPTGAAVRGMKGRDTLPAALADSVTAAAKDPEFKTSAK
ncbi:hypothetical protein [Tabrizicola sp.]|uniref:hypothetical protein n=1 Tax=Tabrizicola sp. TaxID=2005166 RepID=UPI0027333677|nr:hypothetical protein [Tabrizicola sp.]